MRREKSLSPACRALSQRIYAISGAVRFSFALRFSFFGFWHMSVRTVSAA